MHAIIIGYLYDHKIMTFLRSHVYNSSYIGNYVYAYTIATKGLSTKHRYIVKCVNEIYSFHLYK